MFHYTFLQGFFLIPARGGFVIIVVDDVIVVVVVVVVVKDDLPQVVVQS